MVALLKVNSPTMYYSKAPVSHVISIVIATCIPTFTESSGSQLASISTASQVPSTSPLSIPSPSPSLEASPSDPVKDTDVILQRDFLVVEIVLPIALATVVIVVFVTCAGVSYCIRLNKRK